MIYYALHQIRSYNRTIYAEAGDELDVYDNSHYPVMCCRDKRGECFQAHIDKLSETPVVIVLPEVVEPINLFNQPI